jgi:hypothetical protein
MYGRRRIQVRGIVYKGETAVGEMHLEGWILRNDRVVGTVRTVDLAPYPYAYSVPRDLVMRSRHEPTLRLETTERIIVTFHIGSPRGVLVNARLQPPGTAIPAEGIPDPHVIAPPKRNG